MHMLGTPSQNSIVLTKPKKTYTEHAQEKPYNHSTICQHNTSMLYKTMEVEGLEPEKETMHNESNHMTTILLKNMVTEKCTQQHKKEYTT